MLYRLFIDGREMELDAAFTLAKTKQAFNFLKPGSVKSSFTNRLSLPTTAKNKRTLELIAPLHVISSTPYDNHSIRITEDGIEVIPNGVCQILSVNERIEIDVQSGIKNFFDAIDGKYLNDIDTSAWDGLWDDARRHSLRMASSGLVSAVVNSGQLIDATTYVDLYTRGAANIPFFYYKTIIDQIFALSGYTKSGDIFGGVTRYDQLAMSTGLKYNDEWLKRKECRLFVSSLSSDNDGTLPYFDEANPIPWSFYKQGADNFYSNVTKFYAVDNPSSGLAEYYRLQVKFECRVTSWTTGAAIKLVHKRVNSGVYTRYSAVVSSTDNIATIDQMIDMADNDVIFFEFFGAPSGGGQSTITNVRASFIPQNSTDTDLVQDSDWYIYFNQLLPRITLSAFIQDFMKMFGLVMKEENGNIEFKHLEDILNIAGETTLLKRSTNKLRPVNYDLSGFARNNNFNWITPTDDTVVNSDLSNGVMVVDGETLEEEQDLFTSIFTASEQKSEARLNQLAWIPIYSGGGFIRATSFGNRLVLLHAGLTVPIRYQAGSSVTDYRSGYFLDKNQSVTLDLQEFVDAYYTRYAEVLSNWRASSQEFFITSVEYYLMDMFEPQEFEGQVYLVDKISSHIAGESTSVNLIRI